ncbi:MAG: DNA recombination protein RmuC [Muribaculaceae bacterium]|nr:DNA recombination protein RmuC [Muribaculaceae bacterium]
MSWILAISLFLVGLLLGLVVGFFAWKVRADKLRGEVVSLESQIRSTEQNAQLDILRLKESHQSIIQASDAAHAEAMARLEQYHAKAMADLQSRFDETILRMRAEMETATADMLKRRQEEFKEASTENISNILRPLNEKITEMRQAVKDNTHQHAELGGKLSQNIEMVMKQSEAARISADRLTQALRGGGKVQGGWGETLLTELLESQGLTQGVHFEREFVLRDEKGNPIVGDHDKSMRPDVVLHLDRKLDVVIDSKVSLTAYLDYCDAESDEARSAALARHVASVEGHVKTLAKKDYSKYIGGDRSSVGYVIMFIPNTSALHAALSAKPDIWRKAMDQGVYIADEQTLYAALKIIDLTWRQISQADNHQKVYELANQMIDRVAKFMQAFTSIGTKLGDATSQYESALKKLKDGGQSIPGTCRKLIELGAKAKQVRGVDPDLLGISEDDNNKSAF